MRPDTNSPSELNSVSRARPWPDGLVIRAISPADAEGITALQSLPQYRAGTLRLPYPKKKDVEARIENASPDAVSLVAVLDGKIVAIAGFSRFAGRRGHAAGLGMGVHDDYCGRGIGGAILAELLDIADNWMDIRRIELTVFIDNVAAIRLYERFGFETEGTFKSFAFRDGVYVDAHSMARIRGG
ncbi:MAG: GNAT family N-acetyltransferase [Roseibium sp.]|uniref:GNAT family N-acetyltransferase n=1 Tax=Roseibium sp. TaxID=1936156 RepID=UPI00263410DC|nr:GNAT family N-acetyltransferase [Roseibium sp.]MCV0428954.1 GNAT family N-acetyltransferase [Roseibium sp.]